MKHIEKEREVRKALIHAYHALLLCDINIPLESRVYNLATSLLYLPIEWKNKKE